MDQEMKEYIDKKFAELAAQKETEKAALQNFMTQRKKRVVGVVLFCTGLMLLLLCALLYLLYRFQLQSFSR